MTSRVFLLLSFKNTGTRDAGQPAGVENTQSIGERPILSHSAARTVFERF